MSIQTEIQRLQTARNTLRAKAVELGLAESQAKIDAIATAFDSVTNQGAVSASVQEGETYTIPKGYHNGSGTVSGVAGGGNYKLQSKTATPTKMQQNITPDSGFYGLSDVTVNAIPETYQDTSSVTAVADDVLATKVIVNSAGEVVIGTMPNNGTVTKILDTETNSYTIPKGFHSGTGSVSITVEEKTATPTKSEQYITPTKGKVLSKVTVTAIPETYHDTSSVTALAPDVLASKVIVNSVGEVVPGTMPNNGDVSAEIDGLTTTSKVIPAGYTAGGTITLSNDIETALAGI